jgi:hypothetical protein
MELACMGSRFVVLFFGEEKKKVDFAQEFSEQMNFCSKSVRHI